MKVLKDFIHSFDFVKMRPDKSVVKGGVPEKGRVQALVEPGRQYAVYLKAPAAEWAELLVELPKGRYRVEWISVKTGVVTKRETLRHDGGKANLKGPFYGSTCVLQGWDRRKSEPARLSDPDEIALRIKAR